MTECTAVIVAAGLGVRMGARGRLTPKGMIALDGMPLVRASVLHLADRGISKVRIVTGHLAEAYRQEFSATPGVELVHNADYHRSGSLWSLGCGLAGLSGPVVILESDIMYEPRALDPMLRGTSGLVLSGPTSAGDEVYVWTKADSQLIDMSKRADHRDEAHRGELVGISALAATDLDAFRATAQKLIGADIKADYESGLVAHAAGHSYTCPLIDDLAWAEVDDETMLADAYMRVWPLASAGLPRAPGRAQAI
ncbi:NTP transferase domain-containing protein [Pseudooceanicola sp.]|uniref:phosphocholine cytidylyltransferase family protein n=1 Tax=Pseudooceanicola sp. TaxID=1914328 RepID=UPI00260F326B|nr:NTP transferase domain-containing protein [Pseudooceanicola sp.]MDF1856028.1 NTP transferase domain-containing protein [Pseudooceanicola sp.]